MSMTLGLKFRGHGQIYFFDSGPFVVNEGEYVIVNTEQGMGLAQVTLVREEPPVETRGEELKPIYRLATEEDVAKLHENEALIREAHEHCRLCIRERDLDMKLVDVEVFFDRSKIVFYFTAPNRIDFRELVKDLVKTYRTRIELRQIGVRHETQMVGAVGNCGQVCCCRRYLRKFAPVTIKMAKEQNLFLNPVKISGICGRLLCCLSYEQQNYEDFHRQCPKIGKKYATKDGPVKVLRANLFRKSLSILTETGEEKEVELEAWDALNPTRPDQPRREERPDQPEREAQDRGRAPRAEAPAHRSESQAQRAESVPPRAEPASPRLDAAAPQDRPPAALPALREERLPAKRDNRVPTYDMKALAVYLSDDEASLAPESEDDDFHTAPADASAQPAAGAESPRTGEGQSDAPRKSGRSRRRRKRKPQNKQP